MSSGYSGAGSPGSRMREVIIKRTVQEQRVIAVLIDESTNLARATCLVVYVRATFNEEIGPVTFFLDIVELSGTTADAIESALLKCLKDHTFHDHFLAGYWLGLGVDEASVMLGTKSGSAARLKNRFTNIISWHRFNHRLELSVHDAIKSWLCLTQ